MANALQFDLTQPWDGVGLAPVDALLVEGLRAGEERAYEELIDRFQQPVYNLVWRLLADPDDAGDVVQEVFLKVFRGVGSFRGGSSLKTWIYRIAVNEAHNHRRWFHRRRGQEVGLDDERCEGQTYEELLADQGRSPFEIAVSHETRERIEEALQKVRPAYRAALILRDVEGLSYEEVSEILDISLGTVKSRIVRGREALRALLAGERDNVPGLSWAAQGAQS
ncbi:MAG: sigma-70 family RNA polymerase sigma factor [Bryobacteraceae bacterium]